MIGQELSRDPSQSIHEITGRMVAYASKCSHWSVERAGKQAHGVGRVVGALDYEAGFAGSMLN